METLEHRASLVENLLNDHWANYGGYRPTTHEREAHIEWARKLDEKTLRHALNFDNHRKGANGAPIRPILHVLKGIAYEYRLNRGDFYRPPALDPAKSKESECLYCTNGDVFDLYWTGKYWNVKKIGRCRHCSGGDAEARSEIVALSERTGFPVGRFITEALVRGIECQITFGRMPSEGELNSVLAKYGPERPVKAPLPGPEAPTEPPDYDYRDGWEPEPGEESVPF